MTFIALMNEMCKVMYSKGVGKEKIMFDFSFFTCHVASKVVLLHRVFHSIS